LAGSIGAPVPDFLFGIKPSEVERVFVEKRIQPFGNGILRPTNLVRTQGIRLAVAFEDALLSANGLSVGGPKKRRSFLTQGERRSTGFGTLCSGSE
jgi:hypothetical protein